jgi:hypothetical protein
MKTYVITLSKRFPTGHNRAGEPTHFWEKFIKGRDNYSCIYRDFWETTIPKIHTIRANYPLWAKRIAEVERGEACLSIRQWTGKPYRSKQVEIARLTKEDGVGIQKAELTNDLAECIIGGRHYSYVDIARNDGLHPADWLDWFKGYELTQPMAIIHFTQFRY